MAQNAREKVQALTAQLNRYRDEYYNSNAPSVSDEVYDRMYDELVSLEFETGICMTDSPTRTVGYVAVSELEKTTHPIPSPCFHWIRPKAWRNWSPLPESIRSF